MTKYNYNISAFTNKDDVSYYLLGAFMTDGCVKIQKNGKSATLVSKDYDWLETIKNKICPELPIRPHNGSWIICLSCTKIANILIDMGCCPRKSLTLEFPKVPNNFLADFLRGCMDGDGSLLIKNYNRSNGTSDKKYPYISRSCYLCSSSPNFMNDLHSLLNENNLTHSFYETKKKNPNLLNGRIIIQKHPHYKISFGSKSAFNFIKWIYYPKNNISMSRKQNIANDIINSYC